LHAGLLSTIWLFCWKRKIMPGARQQQLQDESRLGTNSLGDLIYLIFPIIHRDFRTTFKVNMSPAKKFCWRMRASIPLPRAC
jgi:hypothetical protein